MSITLLRPATRTHRAFLDRESLRIAAGVRGASRDRVKNFIFGIHLDAGIEIEVAAEDALAALAYVDARVDQINVMRSAPPPSFERRARS